MPTRPLRPVTPVATRVARFHVPFEHGAWWSFGSTLLGAGIVALLRGSDPWACVGALVALSAGFVLQDWAQALLAALFHRRAQALSQWQAPQGWALAVLALGGWALQMLRAAPQARPAWLLLWAASAMGMGLGLWGRIVQIGRGRRSLALTALLLAIPALPLGALAFGFSPRVAAFMLWPLLYYPAVTLAAQSFIRGFPEGAQWLGPALAAALGLLAVDLKAWLPGFLLLVNATLLQRSIRQRWRAQPEGLPSGGAIRAFGRIQAGFGVSLTVAWVWAFATL